MNSWRARKREWDVGKKGTFVFCEASDPNRPDIKGYQQLFLLNDKGQIISRDIPLILGTIKADKRYVAEFSTVSTKKLAK